MHTITLVSTIHRELGKCNPSELSTILEKLKPEVIFLEALPSTYSNYQQSIFHSFEVYHEKLELAAIQKFSERFPVEYVPVLENELPNSLDKKLHKLSGFVQLQRLLDDHNSIFKERGFDYLNSEECSDQIEEMRELERHLLNDNDLEKLVRQEIDIYENSMMKNIYEYCRKNRFSKAVFMCGVAHRKSIISKIQEFNTKRKLNLNWKIYGT